MDGSLRIDLFLELMHAFFLVFSAREVIEYMPLLPQATASNLSPGQTGDLDSFVAGEVEEVELVEPVHTPSEENAA
jgi:hypothetical protein